MIQRHKFIKHSYINAFMHEYQILRHIDDPQMTAVPKKRPF